MEPVDLTLPFRRLSPPVWPFFPSSRWRSFSGRFRTPNGTLNGSQNGSERGPKMSRKWTESGSPGEERSREVRTGGKRRAEEKTGEKRSRKRRKGDTRRGQDSIDEETRGHKKNRGTEKERRERRWLEEELAKLPLHSSQVVMNSNER